MKTNPANSPGGRTNVRARNSAALPALLGTLLLGTASLLWPLRAATAQGVAAQELNIMSFNLRYNEPKDGANAWPHRKELVAAAFTAHQVDFAGLQEVLVGMIDDLQSLLPAYGWIGVGRDDGREAGEFAPIFYNKQKFEVTRHGVFWLSETPEKPGKGWDAAHVRIATWGIFQDRVTRNGVFVINTHMDNKGELARQNGAKLIIQRIADLHENLPVIMTGDLNAYPDSPAVATLTTDPGYKLTDAKTITVSPHVGGTQSSNEFQTPGPAKIIDYIFVGPDISVLTHGYYPTIRDGVFISDHWPVISRISIQRK